jgi:hypothetical protein
MRKAELLFTVLAALGSPPILSLAAGVGLGLLSFERELFAS